MGLRESIVQALNPLELGIQVNSSLSSPLKVTPNKSSPPFPHNLSNTVLCPSPPLAIHTESTFESLLPHPDVDSSNPLPENDPLHSNLVIMSFIPLTATAPRRSARLKVKDLVGSGRGIDKSRLSPNTDTCPLFENFSFIRLTVEEVADLFHSYRIILGDNEQHRDLIMTAIQSSTRISFEILLKCKENLYDMVIVYPKLNLEGNIEFE
jgi:hypothetical protein